MLTSQDDGRSVLRKPWGLGRRIAVASAMFLGLGFLVFATAGANEEGRLTDGIMPQGELQSYCEGLEFGTVEFSEGETAATKLLTLLSKLPPMVSFCEVAGGTFQYAEEDLDPHAKALQLVEQSEGKMDYVEALKKTMFS